jgi:hypothetical protein
MVSPDFAELAAAGRAFRSEAFTDEFVAGVGAHVHNIPDAVVGQYAKTDLYYVASPLEAATIESEGIYPGAQLIDPEDEAFFSEQFAEQQFRRLDPNDPIVVSSFVFGRKPDGTPKNIALGSRPNEGDIVQGAVPEPYAYFVRNMHHLSRLPEAGAEAQEQAAAIVQKYLGRLITDNKVEVSLFSVDPRSPAIARVLLHPILQREGIESGVNLIEMSQASGRLEVPGAIMPEHLALDSTHQVSGGRVKYRIVGSDSMVVFKPTDGYR